MVPGAEMDRSHYQREVLTQLLNTHTCMYPGERNVSSFLWRVISVKIRSTSLAMECTRLIIL